MQRSMCLCICNRIELWLRISSQAISVCSSGTLRLRRNPGEKHWREVLKKYGNFKFSHQFIQILFLSTDESSADASCIEFHE